MDQLKCYPTPQGAVLKEDYILKVRPEGEQDWKTVKTYRVKVDMHDVREASMAYFDFCGKAEVEITFPKFFSVYDVVIRPLSMGIRPKFEEKKITFTLDRPVNISVEINKDRFHNLHIFAGEVEEVPDKQGENVLLIKGSLERALFLGDGINEELEKMPKGRLLYVEAGIYYIGEFIWHLPSHTNIYLEGGAVLIGALVGEKAQNIHISGRGMLYLADFARFSGVNGIRLSHSKNITIENLMFINPPHYTVYLGDCENINICNIKSFSCEGWSDGIDMMSSRNIRVDGGFLRTSDDCIAIYGSRWDNYGGSKNITVKNISVWADVAHPLMIGTHGDHEGDGDMIEDILFENIDILEHHEYQANYLGAMTINAGDKNMVRNVIYRNIRIEPFEHGKLLDLAIKWNKDYNPAPGRSITNVLLEDIKYTSGQGEETSVINGYSEEFLVKNVKIRNLYRDGKRVENFEEANISVGEFVKNITLC